jgi:MFS transporter, DHA1 family, inner membrane transport protein
MFHMRKMPLAIWALVIASFAMGADEFIVAGVVEDIAAALGTTIGAVGLFESAYAIGVAIGAPLFAAFSGLASRRTTLLTAAGIFLLGNLISLVGPDYGWIMVGRIVAALAHGAFFGIAAVFAAEPRS